MIGRATLGNPWILRQIVSYLKEGKVEKEPTKEEKLKTILYHIDLEIGEKGEQIGIKELRKQF
jgi:tRNA-dihydrouridine synthase